MLRGGDPVLRDREALRLAARKPIEGRALVSGAEARLAARAPAALDSKLPPRRTRAVNDDGPTGLTGGLAAYQPAP